MPDAAKLAEQGSTALDAGHYSTAIDLYTQALQEFPNSVEYYIKRSTAHQRNAEYEQALRDAEIAIVLGHQRGKREAIGTAQLRRGISLYLLERYGDAGFCFKTGRKFNPGDKSGELWAKKLEMKMASLEGEDIKREVTIKEIPDVEVPKPVEKEKSKGRNEEKQSEKKEDNKDDIKNQDKEEKTVVQVPVETKIKQDWYQTGKEVVISILFKGLKPKQEDVTVDIQENSISVSFPLPHNATSTFNYDLDPLHYPIVPSQSSWKLLTTKIELKLRKSVDNQNWKSLERSSISGVKGKEKMTTEEENGNASAAQSSPIPSEQPVAAQASIPAYPTSSKKGVKNWDKLAQELTEPTSPGEEYEDEFGGDPVNAFFKKLFKDADDDTKRAMMKSYIESNGTALSTNWDEVKKGKVETSPPEGLVAKKWDE